MSSEVSTSIFSCKEQWALVREVRVESWFVALYAVLLDLSSVCTTSELFWLEAAVVFSGLWQWPCCKGRQLEHGFLAFAQAHLLQRPLSLQQQDVGILSVQWNSAFYISKLQAAYVLVWRAAGKILQHVVLGLRHMRYSNTRFLDTQFSSPKKANSQASSQASSQADSQASIQANW